MKRWMLIAVFVAGCGTREPFIPGEGEPLFPLAKGNRWTFATRDSDGDTGEKTQTVTATLADGGYAMRTVNGETETLSVQRIVGTQLVRESEVSTEADVVVERVRFAPASLRVELSASRLGDTYDQASTEEHLNEAGGVTRRTPKTHHFVVEAVDELIDVPAGEFRAVRVRRDTEGGSSKTYWYVRGVGKIREVGGQIEELSSFDVVMDEGVIE